MCLGNSCAPGTPTCTSSSTGSSCVLAVAAGGGGGQRERRTCRAATRRFRAVPAGAAIPTGTASSSQATFTATTPIRGTGRETAARRKTSRPGAARPERARRGQQRFCGWLRYQHRRRSGRRRNSHHARGWWRGSDVGTAGCTASGVGGGVGGTGSNGGSSANGLCESAAGAGGAGLFGGGSGGAGTGGGNGGGGGSSYVYTTATTINPSTDAIPVSATSSGTPYVPPLETAATFVGPGSAGAPGVATSTVTTTGGASGAAGQNGILILQWNYVFVVTVQNSCTPGSGEFIQGSQGTVTGATYFPKLGPTEFELYGGSGGSALVAGGTPGKAKF